MGAELIPYKENTKDVRITEEYVISAIGRALQERRELNSRPPMQLPPPSEDRPTPRLPENSSDCTHSACMVSNTSGSWDERTPAHVNHEGPESRNKSEEGSQSKEPTTNLLELTMRENRRLIDRAQAQCGAKFADMRKTRKRSRSRSRSKLPLENSTRDDTLATSTVLEPPRTTTGWISSFLSHEDARDLMKTYGEALGTTSFDKRQEDPAREDSLKEETQVQFENPRNYHLDLQAIAAHPLDGYSTLDENSILDGYSTLDEYSIFDGYSILDEEGSYDASMESRTQPISRQKLQNIRSISPVRVEDVPGPWRIPVLMSSAYDDGFWKRVTTCCGDDPSAKEICGESIACPSLETCSDLELEISSEKGQVLEEDKVSKCVNIESNMSCTEIEIEMATEHCSFEDEFGVFPEATAEPSHGVGVVYDDVYTDEEYTEEEHKIELEEENEPEEAEGCKDKNVRWPSLVSLSESVNENLPVREGNKRTCKLPNANASLEWEATHQTALSHSSSSLLNLDDDVFEAREPSNIRLHALRHSEMMITYQKLQYLFETPGHGHRDTSTSRNSVGDSSQNVCGEEKREGPHRAAFNTTIGNGHASFEQSYANDSSPTRKKCFWKMPLEAQELWVDETTGENHQDFSIEIILQE